MNKKLLFTLALFVLPAIAVAEQDAQLNRIENKLDTVVAAVAPDPLKNKTIGVEFNPIRLLLMSKEEKSLSGTISFFKVFDDAELAFPVYLGISNDKYNDRSGNFYTATVDAHYRRFFTTPRNGFYVAGFSRLAALRGTEGTDWDFWEDTPQSGKRSTEIKLGIGFGVGYRIFSKSGFYWGTSLSVGRYLIGESDKFVGGLFTSDDDSEGIVDIEFFKLGLLF